MDPGHSSEYISAHWGALRAGHSVKILPSCSLPSVEKLREIIIKEEPSVIVVSPNHSTLMTDCQTVLKKKELLNQALPEVFNQSSQENIGQAISIDSIPNLRFIVQTGFYNLPGYLKFRDMLIYRSNKYNTSQKVLDSPFSKNKENKKDEKCHVDQFKSYLQKNISSELMENSLVYNILDLQDSNSVNSLLACLSLAQDSSLVTNVIPYSNLDDLLLEKGFVNDLTNNYNFSRNFCPKINKKFIALILPFLLQAEIWIYL